jgi:hypothetical protein
MITMKVIRIAAYGAALFLAVSSAVLAAPATMGGMPNHPALLRPQSTPWIEGVTPPLENELFEATYRILPSHNVLKVYVFDAGGYESAGIRLSGRVPHEPKDLPAWELDREAVELIRTTFDQFPEVRTLDVWATIPVAKSEATEIDNTIFSVSADRDTYETIRTDSSLSDADFLAQFGRVWTAPEVPQ